MAKNQQQHTQTRQNVMLAAQSLSVFVISYYLVYLLCGLSVLYISYDFDIPATLFPNKIVFSIDENNPLWTSDATNSILLATPVVGFFIGISVILLFLINPRKQAIYLYFVIWIFIQAFNMTFGLISENLIARTGLIRVAQVMHIHPVAMVVGIALSLYLLMRSGTFSGKLFFAYCSKPTTSSKAKLNRGLVFFIFPWFAGNSILQLVNGGRIETEDLMMVFFMLVLLIPAVVAKAPAGETKAMPSPKVLFWLAPLCIAVIVLFPLFFRKGFSF